MTGVPRMEMRRVAVIMVDRVHDAKETADLRHRFLDQ
jgi:hypothetical protein